MEVSVGTVTLPRATLGTHEAEPLPRLPLSPPPPPSVPTVSLPGPALCPPLCSDPGPALPPSPPRACVQVRIAYIQVLYVCNTIHMVLHTQALDLKQALRQPDTHTLIENYSFPASQGAPSKSAPRYPSGTPPRGTADPSTQPRSPGQPTATCLSPQLQRHTWAP